MSAGEFDGLVALVTGGASGIGLATATHLRDRGGRVAVLDLDVRGLPTGLTGFVADLRDEGAVRAAVDAAASRLGGMDILVNNAGIAARGDIESTTDDDWHRVLDVNVVGAARTVRAALPHLRRSQYPAIVNTSSVSALTGMTGLPLYSASKGALLALTRALAADLLAEGIRVNCVAPGTVDTPWIGRLLAESEDPGAVRAIVEARQPTGRLVSAEEVAGAIALLASPRSASITGVVLPIDGGMTGTIPAPPVRSPPGRGTGSDVASGPGHR